MIFSSVGLSDGPAIFNNVVFGKFFSSEESDANLDGNKFFQRHAVIVGGTGSGKSWTVANILEKATK
jgi:DNA helicase HerA-like ATPase